MASLSLSLFFVVVVCLCPLCSTVFLDVRVDQLPNLCQSWTLFVATKLVHQQECLEERSQQGEAEIRQEGRSSLLKQGMANELSDPTNSLKCEEERELAHAQEVSVSVVVVEIDLRKKGWHAPKSPHKGYTCICNKVGKRQREPDSEDSHEAVLVDCESSHWFIEKGKFVDRSPD